ncbi:hypothetical protein [uncultured Cohaesibacter sp.]|uniref:hypothetical protein n=1 Tax=uncultured Cohaesibacter sp. TaxID=1002546 RepID=UPI002A0A3F61|nr:hypothetical protein [uncultured Cohaesibacter sp.]
MTITATGRNLIDTKLFQDLPLYWHFGMKAEMEHSSPDRQSALRVFKKENGILSGSMKHALKCPVVALSA